MAAVSDETVVQSTHTLVNNIFECYQMKESNMRERGRERERERERQEDEMTRIRDKKLDCRILQQR